MNSAYKPHGITVSVIMVTYKHETFISEAIEGVLMQLCDFGVELIIADDDSPDGTEEVVKHFIENHPKGNWIKYHKHEKNIGMMPNFLFALKEAKGQYIALCDGDDYWINNKKIQKQFDYLESNDQCNLIFHDVDLLQDSHLISDYITAFKNKRVVYHREDLYSGNFIHTSSVMLRNNLKIPAWYELSIPGDYFLYLIVTKSNKKFARLNETMSIYRVHEGGIWSMQNKEQYQTRLSMSIINCAKDQKIKNVNFFKNDILKLYKLLYWQKIDSDAFNKKEYIEAILYLIKIQGFRNENVRLLFPNLIRTSDKIKQKFNKLFNYIIHREPNI